MWFILLQLDFLNIAVIKASMGSVAPGFGCEDGIDGRVGMVYRRGVLRGKFCQVVLLKDKAIASFSLERATGLGLVGLN